MKRIFESLGPIAPLIERGHTLRTSGDEAAALEVYLSAWETAESLDDDLLRVAASHMVAVVEADLAKKLEWNLVSLGCVERLHPSVAGDCYPTVLANIGYSYLALGNRDLARTYYERAREYAVHLDGEYGESIRSGVDGMLGVLTGP